MFDAVARQRLQAMGFTLYVPAVAPPAAVSPPTAPAPIAVPVTSPAAAAPPIPFWDSALGRNIRRHAAGVDLAAIVLPADPVRAKKSLWRAIQAHRRPR